MSNWDDFDYFCPSDTKNKRETVFNFCLNCGRNPNVKGPRYRVQGASDLGVMLEQKQIFDCPDCKFPVFKSTKFTLVSRLFLY